MTRPPRWLRQGLGGLKGFIWEFPKVGGYLVFGDLIIRILLFGVLYEGPPIFRKPPISGRFEMALKWARKKFYRDDAGRWPSGSAVGPDPRLQVSSRFWL